MKRLACWMVGLALGLNVAIAWAGSPYVSAKLGAAGRFDTAIGNSNIFFDFGPGTYLAMGYEFDIPYRLEAEVGYTRNNFDGVNNLNSNTSTGNYSGFTFMANGYFDVPLKIHDLELPMKPYLGAGIGLARVRVETNAPNFVGATADSDTDLLPAWQAMFGFQTHLSENLTLTGELRLQFTQDPNLTLGGINVDTNYGNQQILFGLRYRF